MSKKYIPVRSPIKWAGGKNRLFNRLLPFIPEKISTLVEPFIGGGAVTINLLKMRRVESLAVVGDMNKTLVNLWTFLSIEYDTSVLLSELSTIENSYNSLYNLAQKQVFYLLRRDEYNAIENNDLRKVALFVFLNKAGFNGLYRVNKSGGFNVPFGKRDTVNLCESIRRTGAVISSKYPTDQTAPLVAVHGDYTAVSRPYMHRGAFFFFDPPYLPVSKTANFTAYDKAGFTETDQESFLSFCSQVDASGAGFVITNAYRDETVAYAEAEGWHVEEVLVGRAISAKSTGRKKAKEVIITNQVKK